jgi:hypothetical protein
MGDCFYRRHFIANLDRELSSGVLLKHGQRDEPVLLPSGKFWRKIGQEINR